MKAKHITAVILTGIYIAAGALLFGCATRPEKAPSTAAVSGNIQSAQSDNQAVQAASGVIDYKDARALQYFK
jgi:uncharacterized lipoprotein YajG